MKSKIEVMDEIMQLLIEVHNELANSSIGMDEYAPISKKLLEAKRKLREEIGKK